MLGIGCPDRHALPLTHPPPSPKMYRPRRPSSRESGFVLRRWAEAQLGGRLLPVCAGSGRSRDRNGTGRFDPKRAPGAYCWEARCTESL